MMTTKHARWMDYRMSQATNAAWQVARWCDQILVFAVVAVIVTMFCTGCAVTESMIARKMPLTETKSGHAVEMAVVSEPRVVPQDGQQIPGLVVQVILLDADGKPTEADGGVFFSIYSESSSRDQKVEADHQWKFNEEEFKQAASNSASFGTVHNFWLPLKGNLASAKRLQLLTLHKTNSGMQLSQWNQILLKSPPTMKIEEFTKGGETDEMESDEEAAPVEEVVPREEAAAPKSGVKK